MKKPCVKKLYCICQFTEPVKLFEGHLLQVILQQSLL